MFRLRSLPPPLRVLLKLAVVPLRVVSPARLVLPLNVCEPLVLMLPLRLTSVSATNSATLEKAPSIATEPPLKFKLRLLLLPTTPAREPVVPLRAVSPDRETFPARVCEPEVLKLPASDTSPVLLKLAMLLMPASRAVSPLISRLRLLPFPSILELKVAFVPLSVVSASREVLPA